MAIKMLSEKKFDSNAESEALEIQVLNEQIAAEEEKINEIYTEIGQLYSKLHADDCEECFKSLIDDVLFSKENIEHYKNEILVQKGIMICKSCGQEIPLNSVFCNLCGKPVDEESAMAHKVICKRCGEAVDEGMRFCCFCGGCMDDAADVPEVPETSDEPELPEPPEFDEIPVIPEPPELPSDDTYERTIAYIPHSDKSGADDDNIIFSDSRRSSADAKRCPVCGYMSYEADMNFCEECGSRLVPAQEPKPLTRLCPRCGEPTEDGSLLYCVHCGSRL